jgi:hypothetical protein
MIGAEGIGAGAASYFALRASSVGLPSAASSLSGGEGAGGLSGGEGGGSDSASISGFGQLFSALQQLQSQSPNQFTQVVSQISNELQTAASQQVGTSQGAVFNNLANLFQNLATTGDLSQFQSQQNQQNGQASAYAINSQIPGAGNNSNLQQLFATIANDVNAVIGV